LWFAWQREHVLGLADPAGQQGTDSRQYLVDRVRPEYLVQRLAGPESPPIILRHNACGEIADPRLTCQHCGQEIDVHDVTPEPGPGFRGVLSGEL
jgi:hypothetical protein